MKIFKDNFLKNIFFVGIYNHRRDYEEARKLVLINSITLYAIFVLLILGIISYWRGSIIIGLFDHAAAVILGICLIYLRRSGFYRIPVYIGIGIMTLLYYYMFFTGGDSKTGFLWYYTYPLFTLYIMGKRDGAIATAILFLPAFIYLFMIWPEPSPLYTQMFTVRFIPSVLCVFLFSYLFESTRQKTSYKLKNKQEELEKSVLELQEKEDELIQAHEELEDRVEKRTEELSMTNEKLKREIEERQHSEKARRELQTKLSRAQKLEAIGILAGEVAHDLNNILSGVISYPELLLLDLPDDSPLKKPIHKIKDSGQKAAAIVQDLLTLARRGVVVTEVINLNNIIDGFFGSPEFEKIKSFNPDIEFEINLSSELNNIKGSPVHISKTIMNLISNAAESISENGIIQIISENQNVKGPIEGYEIIKEGDYVTLSVIDSGIGISPEDVKRIFEPFYTKKVMGRSGTGLGMTVVWSTVKDHNGYIDIKSIEGEGTRCDLYFPVTNRKMEEKIDNTPIEKYKGTEKIVVVDDIKEQREIAYQILTRLGYNVLTFSCGEEAVEYVKSNSADLFILDMIMDPGIDGLDTYKNILKYRTGQKAIIVSGFSETERVKEAQRLGARAYIRKPYIMEELGKTVRDELDR